MAKSPAEKMVDSFLRDYYIPPAVVERARKRILRMLAKAHRMGWVSRGGMTVREWSQVERKASSR